MFILLAESKTMSATQTEIDPLLFDNFLPVFEKIADDQMNYISGMKPEIIADILGVSGNMAKKLLSYAYEFPNKIFGYKSLDGFIGDAYRGLKAESLSSVARLKADMDLRIISSLYGFLRPSDIIKPYRLEFNKPVYPNHQTAIKIFKQKITIEFVKQLKATNTKEIIDLLPVDADKMIDWKLIRAYSKVYKVVFKEMTPQGKLKTPIAKILKLNRGKMCRFILENSIDSFDELCRVGSNDFLFSKDESKKGLPVFIIDG